jgi:hypothetical protein
VPISLTPLQKNVYKTILEKNVDVLKAIAEARRKKAKKPVTIEGGEAVVSKKKQKEREGDVGAAESVLPTGNGSGEVTGNGKKADILEVETNGHTPNGTVANGVSGGETLNGTRGSSPNKEVPVIDGEATVEAARSLTTAPAEQVEQSQAEQPSNGDNGGGGSKET